MLPDKQWRDEWQYEELQTYDGDPIGFYFTYRGAALWRRVNEIGIQYHEANNPEFNREIVDRIIDALYEGDWITQLIAMSNMQSIDSFDLDYIAYLRRLSDDDCTYQEWTKNRERYWNESQFNTVRMFARYRLWELEHYGEAPKIPESENYAEEDLPKVDIIESAGTMMPDHDSEDWKTFLKESAAQVNKPKSVVILPAPNSKAAGKLPHPSGSKPIEKEEVYIVDPKTKQQRLF